LARSEINARNSFRFTTVSKSARKTAFHISHNSPERDQGIASLDDFLNGGLDLKSSQASVLRSNTAQTSSQQSNRFSCETQFCTMKKPRLEIKLGHHSANHFGIFRIVGGFQQVEVVVCACG
jgi:hypothetical protein